MPKVLVIEDDEAVRYSLEMVLKSMGHDVYAAANGIEGVALCQEQLFDLVITDLIMPEMDGVETILELKIQMPELKIIAISGGGKYVDIMETTYRLGADCALTKPFSVNDLSECVNRVLAGEPIV